MRTDETEPEERAGWLRKLLCGATLLMVALSWPLWIDLADFPAVPFVRWFPEYDRGWSWLGLAWIAGGLSLGMTRHGRVGVALTVPAMGWLILGDQLRFQPWVYQFLVLGSLLVILPPRWALGFGRVWMASVYFHSGLSKLDASFVHDMGPLFVRTLLRVLGAGGVATRPGVSLAMPGFEIVVAVLLLIPRTRRVGFFGLVLIHAALLLILGPWGLGHSTIVLVWNLALAVEEFVLFWRGPVGSAVRTSSSEVGERRCPHSGPYGKPGIREKLVGVPFVLLLVMPFTERIGLFDSWPSHALYAAHGERSTIVFRNELPDALPRDLRVATEDGRLGLWTLNPNRWTLRVRGVPAYPQIRYTNGLAEWIAGRIPGRPGAGFYVDHELRSDLRTGRANSLLVRDLREARELSDQFWFNAHPRDRRSR